MDDGIGSCFIMTISSATVAGELQWTLAQQLVIQNDDEGVDQPDSTSSGSAGFVIGIVAFVLIAIAVGAFVLLRPQEEEDDEWFEEFDEEEPSAPIMNPSKSLEQLKSDGTIMDDVEIPSDRRPSLFDEVDNRVSYPGDVSEEVHEEQHDSEENSDDDGITTDEEGTEWWEDEEGVWWYREDGWEDWAVWED
jgi:hypothetical protein